MSEKRFTRDHEWVLLEGDIATIGVTEFAVSELGDVIYVELPEIGENLAAGSKLAVVESVKAASDVYSPVAGTVEEVNDELADESSLLNDDPEGGAWIAKVRIDDKAGFDALMTEADYQTYLKEASH